MSLPPEVADVWKPRRCSECRKPLRKHRAAGRPPDTCGKRCARARHTRQKREARAHRMSQQLAAAENSKPEAVAYSNEFHHWARTGKRGPDFTQPQPATIVSTWVAHVCKACPATGGGT